MSMSRRSFLKATVTTAGALVVYVNTAPLASAKAAKANPMPMYAGLEEATKRTGKTDGFGSGVGGRGVR